MPKICAVLVIIDKAEAKRLGYAYIHIKYITLEENVEIVILIFIIRTRTIERINNLMKMERKLMRILIAQLIIPKKKTKFRKFSLYIIYVYKYFEKYIILN